MKYEIFENGKTCYPGNLDIYVRDLLILSRRYNSIKLRFRIINGILKMNVTSHLINLDEAKI